MGEFLYASPAKWAYRGDWCEMRTKKQAEIAFQLYASLVYVVMKGDQDP